MKNEFNQYWPIYKNLEEETLKITKYIYFTDKQLEVYSMHIADLLVRCAIEIESISKEMYWTNGGSKKYDADGKERDLFFDTDCIAYLNDLWGICAKKIMVSSSKFYFEQKENQILKPLHKAYKRSGAKWNKAYQAVKHDRRESLKKGNLKNLLHAMGALYILNLYYADTTIDLGETYSPAQNFDSRMGSEIFSVTYADVVIGVPIGGGRTDTIFSQEKKHLVEEAVYVLKYKKESWEKMNDALEYANNHMREKLAESVEFQKYCTQQESISEDLMTLTRRFLGSDYVNQNGLLVNFGNTYNHAKKEAVLSRKQIIYG